MEKVSNPWRCAQCIRRLRLLQSSRQWTSRRWQSNAPPKKSLSEVLVTRARLMAAEHETLSTKLAETYSAEAAKRIGELAKATTAFREYEAARSASEELQALLETPDKELREMAEEDVGPTETRLQEASTALEESLIPVHPFAEMPCLIEIRPGAGGDEAALFAGDLLRMYTNFCSRHSLRTSMLKLQMADGSTSGSGAGSTHVQEAILEVESSGSYGLLRCEAGVHRVQRVPATESKGRTHTSAVSVLVLPSIAAVDHGSATDFDDPSSDYYVDPKDVKSEVMRASGAGGQHVNRTESAVRLTHEPTGFVVAMQDSRSQHTNREKAWQVLRSRIAQRRREEREAEMAEFRRAAGAGEVGRESKIRTYNWSQNRVSDHRSEFESRNLDDVMEGGPALDSIMGSVRKWMNVQEVLTLLAEEKSKGQ